MNWMPIETAPTETDVEFLGWNGSYRQVTWAAWIENGKPAYVHSDYRRWEPTHWMPLPEPPEGA